MSQPLPPLTRRVLALALVAALPGLTLTAATPAAARGAEAGDGTAYVLLAAGDRSSMMSGTMEDLNRARSLRTGSEALLFVRRGDGAWIVRDPATLRRAEALFAPQRALGARQGELGKRQAALGRRQAALGRQQAGASPAGAAELGRQQAALGREQNALGREQSSLGREQGRLGREAEAKLRTLVAEAVRSGVAQRVD